MLRAFWTWDPVSSGTYRAFDEHYACENNKWFFDKSVWQKVFRTMGGAGFDAMIMANTHPFPFMLDVPGYPEAKMLDDATLADYQRMHHWIFETALDYEIAPYLLFFPNYYPQRLLEARGIDPKNASVPTDFALDYLRNCVRELLQTYTELAGIFVDAGESPAEFLQQAVLDTLDAVRPDANLYIHGGGEAEDVVKKIKRRGNRPVRYSVEYTYEHLVDAGPDPMFTDWVEAAGAENVLAEFRISNFEPWTSFSFDTVESILDNLEDIGCIGFSLQPLSMYEWPKTSDTYFKYQWQRDLIWYSIWGGSSIQELLHQGQPKWLLRNSRLIPGFQAGSRILELLALYFAGDKLSNWHPQFCSVRDPDGDRPRLLSIQDMLDMENQQAFSGRNWWEEVTGDKVVHLAEYVGSGTPEDAYGPDELIEELADLSEQAVAASEKGMRSASGEKELPSLSRDAFCMGRLGEFYVERLRAALSHARGDDVEALEHMSRALGVFREIRGVDSSHRGPFRATIDRCAIVGDWTDTIKALEAEFTDASNGQFKSGVEYPVNKLEG